MAICEYATYPLSKFDFSSLKDGKLVRKTALPSRAALATGLGIYDSVWVTHTGMVPRGMFINSPIRPRFHLAESVSDAVYLRRTSKHFADGACKIAVLGSSAYDGPAISVSEVTLRPTSGSERARVEIKAVSRESGERLTTDPQTGITMDLSEQIAGKRALQKAAAEIGYSLNPKIVQSPDIAMDSIGYPIEEASASTFMTAGRYTDCVEGLSCWRRRIIRNSNGKRDILQWRLILLRAPEAAIPRALSKEVIRGSTG